MTSTIFNNCTSDRQYKAATGLSISEFDALYEDFAPFYVPKQANPYRKDNAPLLTDKKEALFFIIIKRILHFKIWVFISECLMPLRVLI